MKDQDFTLLCRSLFNAILALKYDQNKEQWNNPSTTVARLPSIFQARNKQWEAEIWLYNTLCVQRMYTPYVFKESKAIMHYVLKYPERMFLNITNF